MEFPNSNNIYSQPISNRWHTQRLRKSIIRETNEKESGREYGSDNNIRRLSSTTGTVNSDTVENYRYNNQNQHHHDIQQQFIHSGTDNNHNHAYNDDDNDDFDDTLPGAYAVSRHPPNSSLEISLGNDVASPNYRWDYMDQDDALLPMTAAPSIPQNYSTNNYPQEYSRQQQQETWTEEGYIHNTTNANRHAGHHENITSTVADRITPPDNHPSKKDGCFSTWLSKWCCCFAYWWFWVILFMIFILTMVIWIARKDLGNTQLPSKSPASSSNQKDTSSKTTSTGNKNSLDCIEMDTEEAILSMDPFLQCTCFGKVRIDEGTQEAYYELPNILPEISKSSHRTIVTSIDSCDTTNLAMIWMAIDISYQERRGIVMSPTILSQRYVLAMVYTHLGGQFWFQNDGWMDHELPACDWFGMSCSSLSMSSLALTNDEGGERGAIKSLSLPQNNVTGTLGNYLVGLTALRSLDLQENNIYGTIPTEIWDLKDIVNVTFDNNFLTGTLPIPSLGSTLYLNSLSLSGNQLSGSLPVLLESTNLHTLNLAKNTFRGTIPDSWSTFTELRDINLYQLDQVTGTIPSSLFHSLSNLLSLRLGRTKLSGDLSNVLDEFPSLETIDLSYTNFRGTISTTVGKLSKLVHFTIGPGTFQGTIPSEIGKCTNLQVLSLMNSNITGELPIEIAELRNLKLLDVSLNSDLSGTILEESNYQTTLEFMDLTGTNIDCPPNSFCTNLNLQISIAKDCDCTCCDQLR